MRITLLQINSSADMAANITMVKSLVQKAAEQRADLIALPENTFLMQEPDKKRTFYSQENHPGVRAAAEMAKASGCWLLVGSVDIQDPEVRKQNPEKTANRSLLFNPEGTIAAHYDKIHLFDVQVGDGQTYRESALVTPGDRAVLATTPWGQIGLTICYDVRFPQLYRTLAKNGASMITVPAAFTQVTGEAHWHVLLRARAIENGCFIIAPAQCGTHPGGRKTFGHALVVDPWGKILTDAGSEEGMVTIDIDLDDVKKTRSRLPSLSHDRNFKFSVY